MLWTPTHPHLLVIANGEKPRQMNRNFIGNEHVIAVDGGLEFCAENDIVPDAIMGDFDSISPALRHAYRAVPQMEMPWQDKSDLEKALQYLFSFPIETVTVWGALGKRTDHTLANLCFLARYPNRLFYETDEELAFALLHTSTIECKEGQRISLLPLGKVVGVQTSGLQWEVPHQDLDRDFFSLSNVAMQDQVHISFEVGDLIAIVAKFPSQ